MDNCTLKNGYITSVEGGKGAMGALIGAYDGEMDEAERKSGKKMTLSVTNTTVENSVMLIKGDSEVEYEGGLIGYAEGNFATHPTIFDLSASKIQPSGSMDENITLKPIGLYRFKGSDDPTMGATWTLKNVSTDYETEIEMDSTVAADVEFDNDGKPWSYHGCTDEFNESLLNSECYGSKYRDLPSFTVTWSVNGVSTTEVYRKGAFPSFKGSTDKPMTDDQLFVFKGWSPELTHVVADVTYTAEYGVFGKVKVTWIVDGVETVEYYQKGETPNFKGETLKEQDERHVYTFTGWDKEITEATEDVTYTAQYETKAKLKITWVIDGVETVETYLEGVKPSYKGKPTKAEDDDYTYKFLGWDKELVAATEDTTYTAVFDKIAKNPTSGEDEKKGGCGSSISVGFVSLMVIGMAGAFAFRRKHD
ncbi:MAG TPA: hypothetical protein DDW30_08150 [Clostridiales bacterium]|nr:hypothetical protein [Clostridiales bacterium]